MTKALDAAVRAAHDVITTEPCLYCFDNPCSGIEGCGCAQAFARAALRAALPAEPTRELIEAMARATFTSHFGGLASWDEKGAGTWHRMCRESALAAYRALRAHLLGDDA